MPRINTGQFPQVTYTDFECCPTTFSVHPPLVGVGGTCRRFRFEYRCTLHY